MSMNDACWDIIEHRLSWPSWPWTLNIPLPPPTAELTLTSDLSTAVNVSHIPKGIQLSRVGVSHEQRVGHAAAALYRSETSPQCFHPLKIPARWQASYLDIHPSEPANQIECQGSGAIPLQAGLDHEQFERSDLGEATQVSRTRITAKNSKKSFCWNIALRISGRILPQCGGRWSPTA